MTSTAPRLAERGLADRVRGRRRVAGRDSGLLLFDAPTDGAIGPVTARAQLTPGETGPHTFTLRQGGRARLRVGGEVVLDGFEDPPPRGEAMIGLVSEEISAEVPLTAGEPVELWPRGGRGLLRRRFRGVVVGCSLRRRRPT